MTNTRQFLGKKGSNTLFNFLIKHKKYTRFIVLSRPRTGSNLLLNSLKRHPHIKVFGEILRGGINDDVKAAVITSAENYLNKYIFIDYD